MADCGVLPNTAAGPRRSFTVLPLNLQADANTAQRKSIVLQRFPMLSSSVLSMTLWFLRKINHGVIESTEMEAREGKVTSVTGY